MKLIDSLLLVWRNLWRMKLRTILTSIGVMIGTAAIVAMISLSIGLRDNAVKSLENFGNLTEMEVQPAFLMPDEQTPIPPDQQKQLNWDAVNELKQVPGVQAVMPVKELRAEGELKVGRLEGHVRLTGVDVREAIAFKGKDIEKGEFLNGPKNEIVISYDVLRRLRDVEKEKREARLRNQNQNQAPNPRFFNRDSGGEANLPNVVGMTGSLVITRQIMDENDEPKFEKKEIRVRIVGQLKQEENRYYGGSVAYVPMDLIEELNKWANPERGSGEARDRSRAEQSQIEFDSITVKVESREKVESAVQQIKQRGFDIWSPASALEEINKFFFVVQMILGGIAAVSLLVASIGIINTMIMSILERTKEIGIMKVIGATVYNIRWLFLIESGAIGLIGGITGLGIAYAAVSGLNYLAANNPDFNMFGGGPGPEEAITQLAVIPMWLAWFAILFSFVIGLLAGIFPAFRASRLSALEAIRSQ
ncbi:ABC transporter permease [Brevibacillus humidisoli]|uniref:ABC transporter permease n=1 Tax=Brevibacillus humidisoli TaxID=2895522 RepID=UPI001E465634|nr:ABC transporter permease [Brevibacillus humidisoli]UFJ39604.1 ABC transporter permease [Brevibacillus humidisoli]